MEEQTRNTDTPQARTNLDSMVVDKLREGILTGAIASGTHLSELKVSKDYGVSRTPVREALCALAADGLIEMIPNRGAFVTSPSMETIQENRILYGHLKALTARQALVKMTGNELGTLEGIVAGFDQPGPRFEEQRDQFHHTLEGIAQMPVLTEMLNFLSRRLPQPVLPPVTLSNEASMIKQGYQYFLAALKSQKPDVAEKALRDVMALNFSVTHQGENQKVDVA